MNKKEYLTSFLKENQKRLPRKLKKFYLKYFNNGYPVMILTKTQMNNLFKQNEESVYKSISRLLNTPQKELSFQPSFTHDYLPKVKTTLTDVCTSKLDNGISLIF